MMRSTRGCITSILSADTLNTPLPLLDHGALSTSVWKCAESFRTSSLEVTHQLFPIHRSVSATMFSNMATDVSRLDNFRISSNCKSVGSKSCGAPRRTRRRTIAASHPQGHTWLIFPNRGQMSAHSRLCAGRQAHGPWGLARCRLGKPTMQAGPPNHTLRQRPLLRACNRVCLPQGLRRGMD